MAFKDILVAMAFLTAVVAETIIIIEAKNDLKLRYTNYVRESSDFSTISKWENAARLSVELAYLNLLYSERMKTQMSARKLLQDEGPPNEVSDYSDDSGTNIDSDDDGYNYIDNGTNKDNKDNRNQNIEYSNASGSKSKHNTKYDDDSGSNIDSDDDDDGPSIHDTTKSVNDDNNGLSDNNGLNSDNNDNGNDNNNHNTGYSDDSGPDSDDSDDGGSYSGNDDYSYLNYIW